MMGIQDGGRNQLIRRGEVSLFWVRMRMVVVVMWFRNLYEDVSEFKREL